MLRESRDLAPTLDLRAVTIAHVGVDFYGNVGLAGAGSLQYTGYFGEIPDDKKGGYRYGKTSTAVG